MGLVSTTIPNLIGGVSQQPYTIRMASQCEEMVNCLPGVVEFLRRRPATRHVAKILNKRVSDAAVHIIDRDQSEQYVAILADNTLRVFDLAGQEKTVNFPNGSNRYLATDNPNTETSFLTINDYTFILNKTVRTAMKDTLTPKRQSEALAFIKQASYSTDYHITLDGTTFTHNTDKDDKAQKLSSTTITNDLRNKINQSGVYTCRSIKSTLWIRRQDGKAFSARVEDSRSNSHMSIATSKVQRFSDLLTVAPNGYILEITGDRTSSFDNYFVRFEANDGAGFDTGVWVETVKPGIPNTLDASTMPHALVREANGTFTFKALEWGKRTCGDTESAKVPTFTGRKLSDIFFYRNRIGLLAGENCILSEAGKFFNFFPSTVTTLVDSDRIDVAASHTKAANLNHAASFSEGLILFSDQTQFLLEHDDVLSPKTTDIKPITNFESSVKAVPHSAGRSIFFATGRGAFSGVREYFVEEDSSLTDATDITSHIPHYIPGEIRKLEGSTNEDCLLALPSKDRHCIALYRYFWNNREKLLSSWSKWTFCGEVLSAAFLDSSLLLVMQYADGVYLEIMNIEPGYTEESGTFEYCLDRKVREKDMTAISFNAQEGTCTITFPYPLERTPLLVSRDPVPGKTESSAVSAGRTYEVVSHAGKTLTVRGDVRNVLFFAGFPYESLFHFSPQILREDTGNGGKLAVTEGRLQLRNMTLTYGDTGYFEVHITPEFRETTIKTYTGRTMGHGGNIIGTTQLQSGTFRFPVMSRAETVSVTLRSSSFLPFQITSAGWEGFYHIRSRRA